MCFLIKLKNKIKISPFIKDIILTTLTSLLSVISAVIVTRLLAEGLGPRDFGAYSLSRRLLGLIAPISVMGMDIALTRYIAVTKTSSTREQYFFSGLVIGVSPGLVLLFGCWLYSPFFTQLIYKDHAYQSLFIATLFLVVSYTFYIVLYAYYRGSGKINQANLWQVGVVGIGPVLIVSFLASSGQVSLIILLLGMLFLCACIPIFYYVYRSVISGLLRTIKLNHFKNLLEYGLPRVPAGFALAGILGVGPFLAPHVGLIQDAGYLSAAQGILLIVQSGVVAFGLVALPKIAQLATSDEYEYLRTIVEDTLSFLLHLGIFATLHLLLWCDVIVNLLLGAQYREVVPIMRILMFALIPYLGYVLLRSIVDAVEKKAFNTLNLFLSFGVTLILDVFLVIIGAGTKGLAWGTTIGLITLGILTTRFLWLRYQLDYQKFQLKEAVLINLCLILIAVVFKYFLHNTNNLVVHVYILIMEVTLFTLFIFMLWKVNVPWLLAIKKRILKEPVET